MRLGSVTLSVSLSAVLLSGCSFIGGQASGYKNPFAKQKAAHHGQYGVQQYGQHCQIASPRQPIPRGCRPEQVTIGTAGYGQPAPAYGAQGGFPQQPQFGQPQYTDGAYGRAVGQNPAMAYHTRGPKKRKPKLRGALSFGLERSVGGDLIDYDSFSIDPIGLYNPQTYNEVSRTGADGTGDLVEVTFTANQRTTGGEYFRDNTYEEASVPNISFDDAWASPASISGGLEYIAGDKTTFFANAGYSHSRGNSGTAASVQATLFRVEDTGVYDYIPPVDAQPFIPGTPSFGGTPEIPALIDPLTGGILTPGIPAVPASPGTNDTPAVAAVPEQYIRTGTSRSVSFIPNEKIAEFDYDFSDMRRINLEAGARHYLNPLVKSDGYKTVTPFVGASAGVSHYDQVDVKVTQRQRFYERGFALGGEVPDANTPAQFYDIAGAPTTVRIFDDQWVPAGQLNVGAEWQVTPGAALALESGLRVEGGRKYSNGERADANISIPVTLRGSVNF